MNNGYPAEEELKIIREWIVASTEDYHALMAYVRDLWAYSAYGFEQEGNIYKLHTVGWSGNEDLIAAMEDNAVFWAMYCHSWRRGGHYIFCPTGEDLTE